MTKTVDLITLLRDASWGEGFRDEQMGIRLSFKEKRQIEQAVEKARRAAKLPTLKPSTWARVVLLLAASHPQEPAAKDQLRGARLPNGEGSIAIEGTAQTAPSDSP